MASKQPTVKPWAGRFSESTDRFVEEFTESVSFDRRLYRHDIQGSIAHVRMLAHCGVLTGQESTAIVAGLESILADIEAGRFQWRQEQPFSVFRQVYINFNGWDACNFGWENLFSGGNIDLSMQFKNQWFIDTGIAYNARSLSPSALRGGPSLRFPPSWQKWFYISTDNRKAYQLSLSLSDNKFTDQISNSYNISPGLLLRPSDAFSFSFYPFYDYNRNDLQYVETIESDSDNHYVFGRINQKTLGMVIRFTYCITPDLTIQFYGMPFVSAGTYTHLKEITDPRADVYDDRFHTFSDEEINYLDDDEIYQVDLDRDENTDYTFDKPDFNFRQFRSNLVIRWEYTPGSTLYLVWSQNRTGFENMGDFSIGGDMRDLFDVPPHNVILLKLNKWFSI